MSAAKNRGGKAGGGERRARAGSGRPAPSGSRGLSVAPKASAAMSAPFSAARLGVYALLLVLGALVALAGGLVQGAWFPGGLILALAGIGGLFYGGVRMTGTAAGVVVPGASWLVTVFLLLGNTRPEGDFLFGAGVGSYVFLLGGIVVAVICATAAQMKATGVQRTRVGG